MSDACIACGTAYKANAAFCAACGQRRIVLGDQGELRFVFTFYIAVLLAMVPGFIYVAHMDGDVFKTDIVLSAIVLVVTLGFALTRRSLWWPLYKTAGFGLRGYAIVVLAAPIVLALVLGYVHGLSKAFGLHVPNEIEAFTGHHILWAIGLIAIMPPLVEELAYRGVIFSGLRASFGLWESIVISSFAFALMHISLPALITHLPLGMYFCYLRYRSNSLWPSMLAHALHNAGVILIESL